MNTWEDECERRTSNGRMTVEETLTALFVYLLCDKLNLKALIEGKCTSHTKSILNSPSPYWLRRAPLCSGFPYLRFVF
jgi:hypothetical protein